MNDKKYVIEFSTKTILGALLIVFSFWAIVVLKSVLVTFLLSLIIAMALTPLVAKLEKKKIPRSLSILLLYIAVFGAFALIVRLIIPPFATQVSHFFNNKEGYIDTISGYFQSLSPGVQESVKNSLSNFGNSIGGVQIQGVFDSALGLFSGIIGLVFIMVVSFYIILDRENLEKSFISFLPEVNRRRALSVINKIAEKIFHWLRGQILLAFIVFAMTYIGLLILKVDYALTIALLAGLLEIVPYIGPIVSGIVGVMIALTASPLLAIMVGFWFVLVQQIENHILVPQIMKKSLGLNPLTIIFALIIGGKLLGIVGMIVSVPIVAALSVIFNEYYTVKTKEN